MAYFFLGILAIVLLILLFQKLETAETKLLVATLKWTLVGVMVVAAFYLTLVGRLLHVAVLVILLALLFKREFQLKWLKRKAPPLSLKKPLTKKEAASLLSVPLKASPEEIEEAFRLIKVKDASHRDLLAQARDKLLKSYAKKS